MPFRYPAYFDQFHCLASHCPDSCCQEWEVEVDDDAARRYRAAAGKLGDILRQHLYREDGAWYLRITDRRCPMWRPDGLCSIQSAWGHDVLCQTCRDFPRLTHDYGTLVERGLELSCPEAARLILDTPPAPWVERSLPQEGDHDPDLALLLRTREEILEILEDRRHTVAESLALALLYGYHAQSLLDGGGSRWDAQKTLTFGKSLAKPTDGQEMIAFYRGLDILTDRWRDRLDHPQHPENWDDRLRRLAQYGIERYYLQAISDFDLAGRVKMVVLSCLLVHHLGGDLIQTAQLYSKEIENSAENVDAILDGVYESPALTDDKLLGLLFPTA